MEPFVLIVEDDRILAGIVERFLIHKRFRAVSTEDGYKGLELATALKPDVVLVDVMLPGMDGYTFAQRLRERMQAPIIYTTARGDELDRLGRFDLGADDYVAKPFTMEELLVRVRAALHRSIGHPRTEEGEEPEPEVPLLFPGLRIDPHGHVVERAGARVNLTPKEFDLLWFLALRAGTVVKRTELLAYVWGQSQEDDDRTLHTHVNRLRAKLQETDYRYIHTVWGIGYKFEVMESGRPPEGKNNLWGVY
jgi:DNA-binding response OmpR family regulator